MIEDKVYTPLFWFSILDIQLHSKGLMGDYLILKEGGNYKPFYQKGYVGFDLDAERDLSEKKYHSLQEAKDICQKDHNGYIDYWEQQESKRLRVVK